MSGVSHFGRKIIKDAGGPVGAITCYTEVSFPPFEPDGPQPRPDGIIRSVRGGNDWKALVEVKVGDSPLEQEQFEIYHRLARDHGFNAVITVSSQAARADGLPPLNVDGLHQPIPKEATPRRFVLEWTRPLHKGRGRSTAPVLDGIAADLEEFYGRVVEGLVPYVPPAPRLPSQPPPASSMTPQSVTAATASESSGDASEQVVDKAPSEG